MVLEVVWLDRCYNLSMKSWWFVLGSKCICHFILDTFFHLNRVGVNGKESHVMVLSGSKVYVSRKSGERAVEGVRMNGLAESELDCGGSGEVDSVSEAA